MIYETMKVLPVVDYEKLSDEQKEAFDKVDLGKGNIPQDELLSKRLPVRIRAVCNLNGCTESIIGNV